MHDDNHREHLSAPVGEDHLAAWHRLLLAYETLNAGPVDGGTLPPLNPQAVRGAIAIAREWPDMDVDELGPGQGKLTRHQVRLAKKVVLAAAMVENAASRGVVDAGVLATAFRVNTGLVVIETTGIAGESRARFDPTGASPTVAERKAMQELDVELDKLDSLMTLRAGALQMTGGAPMGRRTGKGKRPGRPNRSNAKEDKRIAEAWATRHYEKYEEVGRELKLDPDPKKAANEVRRAIDRHRHRKARTD